MSLKKRLQELAAESVAIMRQDSVPTYRMVDEALDAAKKRSPMKRPAGTTGQKVGFTPGGQAKFEGHDGRQQKVVITITHGWVEMHIRYLLEWESGGEKRHCLCERERLDSGESAHQILSRYQAPSAMAQAPEPPPYKVTSAEISFGSFSTVTLLKATLDQVVLYGFDVDDKLFIGLVRDVDYPNSCETISVYLDKALPNECEDEFTGYVAHEFGDAYVSKMIVARPGTRTAFREIGAFASLKEAVAAIRDFTPDSEPPSQAPCQRIGFGYDIHLENLQRVCMLRARTKWGSQIRKAEFQRVADQMVITVTATTAVMTALGAPPQGADLVTHRFMGETTRGALQVLLGVSVPLIVAVPKQAEAAFEADRDSDFDDDDDGADADAPSAIDFSPDFLLVAAEEIPGLGRSSPVHKTTIQAIGEFAGAEIKALYGEGVRRVEARVDSEYGCVELVVDAAAPVLGRLGATDEGVLYHCVGFIRMAFQIPNTVRDLLVLNHAGDVLLLEDR